MLELQPIGDKIAVQKLDPDERTKGGVIIPDIAQEESNFGKVLAVGPGRYSDSGDLIPMQCKVGDMVYYPKFAAKKIEIEEEEFYLMREIELLTIWEKKDV
jgi:chaperonin GroES